MSVNNCLLVFVMNASAWSGEVYFSRTNHVCRSFSSACRLIHDSSFDCRVRVDGYQHGMHSSRDAMLRSWRMRFARQISLRDGRSITTTIQPQSNLKQKAKTHRFFISLKWIHTRMAFRSKFRWNKRFAKAGTPSKCGRVLYSQGKSTEFNEINRQKVIHKTDWMVILPSFLFFFFFFIFAVHEKFLSLKSFVVVLLLMKSHHRRDHSINLSFHSAMNR